MNFLLDMPVSPKLVSVVQSFNYTGIHVSTIGLGTATDLEILDKARNELSIIITADLDFPRLIALSAEKGPGLILFRGGNYSDNEMKDLLIRVLEKIKIDVLKTSICVVDKQKIRLTKLPIKSS
jgi:predicted nuclease of predicted toxin-antitoxin system